MMSFDNHFEPGGSITVRRTAVSLDPLALAATPPALPAPINSPLEWTDLHPVFVVPEWQALSAERLPASNASRHFLVLGETGSGKTKSAITPLIRAALEYPRPEAYDDYVRAAVKIGQAIESADDLRVSALIIDPKHELGTFAQEVCDRLRTPERLVTISPDQGDLVLHLFEGQSATTIDATDATQRIVDLSDFYHRQLAASNQDAFWLDQAMLIISSLLTVDLHVYARAGVEGVEDLWYAAQQGILRQLSADPVPVPNAPPSPASAITPESFLSQPLYYSRDNYVLAFYTLINLASITHRAGAPNPVLTGYLQACERVQVPPQALLQLQNLSTLAEVTFGSIVAFANGVLQELSSLELSRHLSLNPFEPPATKRFLSIEQAMNEGKCLVYSVLSDSPITELVGRALKAKFFEVSFRRVNRVRPCYYICDEFQRFITSDRVSGEQSYLDRCRAFRGVCVLATQSLASLRYALATSGGADLAGGLHSLDVLMNNTGNKLFFRNTDVTTQQWLKQVFPLPHAPNKPHVIEVRPTSTLQVGEAYYLWSNGKLGRSRIRLRTPA